MKEPQKKQAWLNINTGEFSNSWGKESFGLLDENTLKQAALDGWKLIEFTCINDPKFEFTKHMKLR